MYEEIGAAKALLEADNLSIYLISRVQKYKY
jgi:hypothetical protein